VGPRLSIVAGLLAGVLVAAFAIAVLIVALPGAGSGVSASPTASALPTLLASPSASASMASASASLAASVSPGGSATLFHVGETAPPLALPQVGGGTIDLGKLRGKPVWVNFMQTTCPPCVDEFPLMNGFAVRHADDGLVIVAVDIREDEGTVATFAESLRATFPVALDTDGAAQQAWGAYGLPVHFWIDAEGVVRDGALGGIGPDIMARGLRTILPGVDVTP
jgi:cytochrome c biogenesis protein CcmG/thiol:disulfide interchange protein DsbE